MSFLALEKLFKLQPARITCEQTTMEKTKPQNPGIRAFVRGRPLLGPACTASLDESSDTVSSICRNSHALPGPNAPSPALNSPLLRRAVFESIDALRVSTLLKKQI
jgi:hypothetical protein